MKDEEQLKTKGETLDKEESMLWIWLLPSILKNRKKIRKVKFSFYILSFFILDYN